MLEKASWMLGKDICIYIISGLEEVKLSFGVFRMGDVGFTHCNVLFCSFFLFWCVLFSLFDHFALLCLELVEIHF
jgi:hypothetical protein